MIQIGDSYTLPAPLPLEEGGLLVNAQLAYEAHGELAGENTVVLLHDLTQSHRALGEPEVSRYKPSGWARELVGPGRVLEGVTDYLVSPNLLGSPFGSTSPLTQDSASGKPIGPAFPTLTVEDMARAIGGLLRGLRIRRVRLLLGLGLGGMVALRMAALFPELAAGVVTLGAARSLPEGLREQLALTGQFLRSDPAFLNGAYLPGPGPRRSLQKLRLEMLRRAYGRDYLAAQHSDLFAVERALEEEAEAFAEQFDASCYAHLCAAYGAADLTESLPRIGARVLLISSAADELAPPIRVRDTYHLLTAAGVSARYYEVQSQGGHALLASEAERLRGPIGEFLSTL